MNKAMAFALIVMSLCVIALWLSNLSSVIIPAMRYLIVIPGAIAGFMIGMMFLGIIPGLIIILLWWGPDSFEHPDLIARMMRPAGIVGAVIGAVVSVVAVQP